MRFVSPETVRIDLTPGPKGEPRWIEIRKELSAVAMNRYRSASLIPKVIPGVDGAMNTPDIGMDLTKLSVSRIQAYMLDWSAKDEKGKPIKYTLDALEALDRESFDEIDNAIGAYLEAQEAEKKQTAGASA